MNQKVHVTKNATEWLFDGYDDQMINLAKDNPFLDAGDIPFDRFGWFYMVRKEDKAMVRDPLRITIAFFYREMIAVHFSEISMPTRVSTISRRLEKYGIGTMKNIPSILKENAGKYLTLQLATSSPHSL
jgi:hypothetical protein